MNNGYCPKRNIYITPVILLLHMFQKYNLYKVLSLFFENPLPKGGFQLREISRKVKIAPTSVKRYLLELEKNKLIIKQTHRLHKYPLYYANRDNDQFRFYQKIHNLILIKESGLLDYLSDECMPNVIILFGSASKGEDLIDSDLDIFMECEEVKLDLKKYEKIINRKISILFNPNFSQFSTELKHNVINGIILKGYLKF